MITLVQIRLRETDMHDHQFTDSRVNFPHYLDVSARTNYKVGLKASLGQITGHGQSKR